jgi:isocitrate dehydrogenase
MSGKSPSRKVNELDNRGSHFYLALYWAQELANQTEDAALKEKFAPLAAELAENEDKIVKELNAVQGKPVDLKGYYNAPEDLIFEVMRPSDTLNGIFKK